MCMCHRVADKKYAIACNEIAEPNSKYITVDDTLKNIRQYVLEFILANHSLDCPICDQVWSHQVAGCCNRLRQPQASYCVFLGRGV